MGLAHTTAHAFLLIHHRTCPPHRQRIERARIDTHAARCAIIFIDGRDVTRRNHRTRAVFHHSFDAAATTFATVANRKHATADNIFEPRRMNVPAFVFFAQNFDCFILGDTPRAVWIMFDHEIVRASSNRHAHIRRLARILTRVSACAFIQRNPERCLEHDIARYWIRNDLLDIARVNVVIELDQFDGEFGREHFAMIGI